MKNFFVYGGCISRDIFNPEYNVSNLKLAHYAARTSIVKLSSPPCLSEIKSKYVTSPFQSKAINNDAKNNLLEYINKINFDFFLMDFMFLKYRVVECKNTWLTYSSELKKAKVISSSSQMINAEMKVFWVRFEEGLRLLLDALDKKGHLDSLILNKLYLSEKDADNIDFDNQSYISKQNEHLDKAYSIASKYLNRNQFIVYDENLFVGDPNHKWGRDPMHYIPAFYEDSYSQLLKKITQ